jgi:hypothetical protein
MNRHTGRDAMVLGNGPSLKECRAKLFAFIEKYKPLVFGVNRITPDVIKGHCR